MESILHELEKYPFSLQEGYLLSDKTISVNLDQFVSGKKKKLLIIGVPGSGKTSLGQHLVKKYRVEEFVTDTHWKKMLAGIKSNKRSIVEGAGLAILYKKEASWRKVIIKQPMIILGMSAIKAGLRADKRDGLLPGQAKDWKDTYYFVRNNITYFQIAHNLLRKDATELPNAVIAEFKVPRFKPVYF